jgi:hypothetical protein
MQGIFFGNVLKERALEAYRFKINSSTVELGLETRLH